VRYVRCVNENRKKRKRLVATASTEHSYWLALATHATQAIAFEWKPGLLMRGRCTL